MATITVRGTGTAYGTPDEATLGLAVESVRPSAAEALGGRLGTVVSARDAHISPPEPRPMMRMAAMDTESMPVAAGELSVVAVVDVEFHLEQA